MYNERGRVQMRAKATLAAALFALLILASANLTAPAGPRTAGAHPVPQSSEVVGDIAQVVPASSFNSTACELEDWATIDLRVSQTYQGDSLSKAPPVLNQSVAEASMDLAWSALCGTPAFERDAGIAGAQNVSIALSLSTLGPFGNGSFLLYWAKAGVMNEAQWNVNLVSGQVVGPVVTSGPATYTGLARSLDTSNGPLGALSTVVILSLGGALGGLVTGLTYYRRPF